MVGNGKLQTDTKTDILEKATPEIRAECAVKSGAISLR
jgi:hypothetical protein